MTESMVNKAMPAGFNANSSGMVGQVMRWDGLGLSGVLIVGFVVLSFAAPNFLSVANLLNVLQQAAFFGIIAFAMTLVIVAGEIDISVGSLAALSSACLGVLVVNLGWSMLAACIAVILLSILSGSIAGFLRAQFNVPTFISTLALYLALRGLAMLLTQAFTIPIPSKEFFYWGSGKVLGVLPVAAIYMVIMFAIVYVISQKTVFGRSIYAVGGNAKAAQLAGINVKKTRIIVLALTGFAGGFTGLLQSAQLSSGNPTIGNGLEFDAISAVIIGGAAMAGGKGKVSGTLLGVFLMALLSNGMVLLGINPYGQNVVRGAIVLGAVLISVLRTDKAGRA